MFTRYQYKVIRYACVLLPFSLKRYVSKQENSSNRRATLLPPGVDMGPQILQHNNTNKRNYVKE
jgi:hypothetical protein